MLCKEEIINIYKYKMELHAHTKPASLCSEITAEEMVRYISKDGFDGVAITNHYTINHFKFPYEDKQKNIERYLQDFWDLKGRAEGRLSVCLGMEIGFAENRNEYLVYGINETDVEKAYAYLDKGIAEFYREFKNDKNVILQAHPFRDGMILSDDRYIDGIELYNFHPGHNSKNTLAADYIKTHKDKLFSGGVDFHHTFQRGLTAARFKYLPKDSYELCEAIKSKDIIFEVGESIILP